MMLDNASGWKPANPGPLRIGLRGVRLTGLVVEAWRKLLNYVAEFAAAGIYLRGFRRQMEHDTGGVVGSEEVGQTLSDPSPDLVPVGSRIVLKPDGERVPRGLQDLVAAYASGFLDPGGYRHGQQHDLPAARAGNSQDLIGLSLHRDCL